MQLLICPHCGQSYNPRYMRYCARCGEAVPDERGKLPRPGPMDGMGARGGSGRRRAVTVAPPAAPEHDPDAWVPTHAVDDMVLEYRTRLNEMPQDHSTRYALAVAYLLARRWDRAAQELTVVVEGLPDYADAHFRLAVALAHTGNHADALVAARRAVALEPGNERYASVVSRLEAVVANDS